MLKLCNFALKHSHQALSTAGLHLSDARKLKPEPYSVLLLSERAALNLGALYMASQSCPFIRTLLDSFAGWRFRHCNADTQDDPCVVSCRSWSSPQSPQLLQQPMQLPQRPPPPPPPSSAAPPPPPPPPAPVNKRADGRVIATPYAKKLAKDMGIDLANIGGSGPNGRITASDVEAAKNGGEALAQSISDLSKVVISSTTPQQTPAGSLQSA